jgi:hypothetical protein
MLKHSKWLMSLVSHSTNSNWGLYIGDEEIMAFVKAIWKQVGQPFFHEQGEFIRRYYNLPSYHSLDEWV